MEPLSCRNCCHNPLQLGSVGTAFGFCVRHHVTLLAPHLTTCGQLLRKDLRAASAVRARDKQREMFPDDYAGILADAERPASNEGLIEANGQTIPDAVVEEVKGYGLPSKIATLAALHRVPGVRAEIAMLSLGRGYFQNCVERRGKWTSGVHIFQWTMMRLTEEPLLQAGDLQGPMTPSLKRTLAIATWQIVVFRLIFAADVAQKARQERDPAGKLMDILQAAIEQTQPGSPESLLSWLRKNAEPSKRAFPPERYEELRRSLHRPEDDTA